MPIFTTDPNERQTYGALLAIIDAEQGAFRSLLVPYVTYNPLLGAAGSVHYERFFADRAKFDTDVSQSTRNQAFYRLRYADLKLRDPRYLFEGFGLYENDRTARFFGIGANSREPDEANYTLRQVGGEVTFGRRLLPELIASLTERLRHVTIRRGAVDSLPFLKDVFTGVPGDDGSFVWAHRLALTYDTRNSLVTATRGSFGQVFLEVADEAIGSEASFIRYGLQGRWMWPHLGERLVLALRGLLERVDGSDVPFFELSELGGDETLRGFGENRFLDEGRVLFNAEERIRVYQITYGDVRTDIELAVFSDVGRVFRNFSDLGSGKIQAVVGGGIRFLAASQIVAKIDVGMGSEGLTI
ncbi:MAG: outer membrane protein assembly factor, partial [Candidatus Tectomicrobia bacterium]|nr:outer membrane protein assembly factor [Candidatus Tectomicrobia bacterium]